MLHENSQIIKPNPRVYDFRDEARTIMVLGGYILIKKPYISFILNTLWITFIFLYFVYISATAIITIFSNQLDEYDVDIILDMCLFISLSLLCASANITRGKLNSTINYLNTGLFAYEENNEEVLRIQQKYIQYLRKVKSVVYKLISYFALSKLVLPPLLRLVLSKNNTKDKFVNPYLPLNFYVPFNTQTPLGFTAAFFSHAMYPFFVNVIFASHMEAYVSVALQFTAHIEVLTKSLRNIEKRANIMFKKRNTNVTGNFNGFYTKPEYQRCLLYCLRENVLHHHAILRLKKLASAYQEMTDGVGILVFSLMLASATTVMVKDPTGNLELVFMIVLVLCGYLVKAWLGQLITNKSAEVKDALYTTPWHSCGKKFRALLITMMMNTQTPIILHAWGFRTNVSFENYANMISLAYKITNVLR